MAVETAMMVALLATTIGLFIAGLVFSHKNARRLQDLAHQNALLLEGNSWRQQMRQAAIDKRLAVYQEGYSRCARLRHAAHDGSIGHNFVADWEVWWFDHCLYLNEASRSAFWSACKAAAIHQDIKRAGDSKAVEANWHEIQAAMDVLAAGASLPPIADQEFMPRIGQRSE